MKRNGNSICSETKPPLLELTPKNALTFRGKLGHVGSVSLDIKNCEMCSVYFKVKSNANHFYSVRPNTGVIGAYGRVKVVIQLHDDSLAKLDEIEENKHKFLIMAAIVSDASIGAEKFWKGKKEGMDGIFASKMKTEVHKLYRSEGEKTVPSQQNSEENVLNQLLLEKEVVPNQQNAEENVPNGKNWVSVEKVPKQILELCSEKEAQNQILDLSSEANVPNPLLLEKEVPNQQDSEENVPNQILLEEEVPNQILDLNSEESVPNPHLLEKEVVPNQQNAEENVPNPLLLEKEVVPNQHNSDLNSCAMESTHVSSANHFFAQYCAEMVETLLGKMSDKDAFHLRKEMNDVLTKYEAATIDDK
ncbi:hypothetical protein niasHS_001043 [Heterodera schachtii]|uniref:Major sperm protein n=1 Tax=Heterodera schachtii TaxID=97005 RepID=A0ABD2K8M0_HETSC